GLGRRGLGRLGRLGTYRRLGTVGRTKLGTRGRWGQAGRRLLGLEILSAGSVLLGCAHSRKQRLLSLRLAFQDPLLAAVAGAGRIRRCSVDRNGRVNRRADTTRATSRT